MDGEQLIEWALASSESERIKQQINDNRSNSFLGEESDIHIESTISSIILAVYGFWSKNQYILVLASLLVLQSYLFTKNSQKKDLQGLWPVLMCILVAFIQILTTATTITTANEPIST